MESMKLFFADAESSFEDGHFVIFGVPFDGTCSHRKGTGLAPKSIREESYNFETYLFEHEVDLEDIPFHDMTDVLCANLDEMLGGVGSTVEQILEAGKLPIVLGGEHSLTPPAVRKFSDVGVVILDAHLDFRDQYLDEPNSHACATRRVYDIVGPDNVITIGVRSMERLERKEAELHGLNFIDATTLRKKGMAKSLADLKWEKIYLSLDMDFIDPSYAPGVGNPEYFGFAPEYAKDCINILADRLVGFDVCEVSPPYDNGNTAALAA
ncbi:MAG: agmatinase, partial [Gammaproteobacteria bacterium]|nr:agmatinase [Gammaproteobacteria bacterium]